MSYEETCRAMREAGWMSHLIAAVNLKGLVSTKSLEEALTATKTFQAYTGGRSAPEFNFHECAIMGVRYLDAEGRHETVIAVNHRDRLVAQAVPARHSVFVGFLDDFPAKALVSRARERTASVAPVETYCKTPLRRSDYDIPHLCHQSRSEFYVQVERELSLHTIFPVQWTFFTSCLPTLGWDEGSFLVRISKDATFEIDRPFPDWRRFPARIRAAATVLRDNWELDSFEMSHHDGVLTIRRLGRTFASTWNYQELEADTAILLDQGVNSAPAGIKNPVKARVTREDYLRDPIVQAWVLQQAAGRCEGCGETAPFEMARGRQFLEVYHLKPLADGGSDCVTNAVALCPTCLRRCQYSREWLGFIHSVYLRLPRLVPE